MHLSVHQSVESWHHPVWWRCGVVCPPDCPGTHHRGAFQAAFTGDFCHRCHAPDGQSPGSESDSGARHLSGDFPHQPRRGTGSGAMHLYCRDVDFSHQPACLAVWRGVSPRRPGDTPPEVVSGSIGLEISDFCRIKAALCSFCCSGRLGAASEIGWSARIL